MRVLGLFACAVAVVAPWAGAGAVVTSARGVGGAPSTAGVEALVQRRMPQHLGSFEFAIVDPVPAGEVDSYTVSSSSSSSSGGEGKIRVEGNSVSALLSGLHRYLADVVQVDIWWFVGSRLDVVPAVLSKLSTPLEGSSVVPYRYHFNTVTTSYTGAFWSWEDWELQLDWMALRGINLPLAWIGVEKIFIEVFQEVGFTDVEIEGFLSGPAFLAWNHFGNIQGSWGGELPFSWVDSQFALQQQILARMVELGMTPILPAFPGFVPPSITDLYPNASVVNGSSWEGFPADYTSDTFLDPFDPLFTQMQQSFISRQKAYYGNISSFYALDQFNENNPTSGDVGYLQNVSMNTWKTLKAADPEAVWVMQGWLFSSNSAFWTDERVEAFLGGVPVNSDMLVLDLFSESQPQWQRTNSYYGKPWVWCELHGYGGNMGLYGQVMNVTINPVEALHNSSSLVGFGLTMEGQEGNEIMYDLLLDQAWSQTPIDTETYFRSWVATRYAGSLAVPNDLYAAWDTVRSTVYNNTNLTANSVPKSILELVPSTSGLVNRTGHHPTQINYDPAVLVQAWTLMYTAGLQNPLLFANPAYQYDLVDWTRQVLANAFTPLYTDLVALYDADAAPDSIRAQGDKLLALLATLDSVLSTNANFLLSTWTDAARATVAGASSSSGAGDSAQVSAVVDVLEYDARNQVTLWGPSGQISDYASKSWAGLVSGYYLPRWGMFVDYLASTAAAEYNQTVFNARLVAWEQGWVNQTSAASSGSAAERDGGIEVVLPGVMEQWRSVFALV